MGLKDAALGIGLNIGAEVGNQIFGELNQDRALRGQKKALQQQNAAALEMWEKTNYSAQMEQLQKAGLNPGLIYGMGGAGGGTMGSSSGNIDNSSGGMSGMAMLQSSLIGAQIEKTKADANLANTQANKLGGVDTQLATASIGEIAARTANEKLKGDLMELDKTLKGLDAKYQGATVEQRIASVDVELQKSLNVLRQVENATDISNATKDTQIRSIQLGVVKQILELEVMKQGIAESKSRINLNNEQADAILRQIIQKDTEIIERGKDRNVREQQLSLDHAYFEYEKMTGIPADLLKTVLGAGIIQQGLKTGGKQGGKWGTNTRADGSGYELK